MAHDPKESAQLGANSWVGSDPTTWLSLYTGAKTGGHASA